MPKPPVDVALLPLPKVPKPLLEAPKADGAVGAAAGVVDAPKAEGCVGVLAAPPPNALDDGVADPNALGWPKPPDVDGCA